MKIEPEGKFVFAATVGLENVSYELDLQLFDKINVEVPDFLYRFFFEQQTINCNVCIVQMNYSG